MGKLSQMPFRKTIPLMLLLILFSNPLFAGASPPQPAKTIAEQNNASTDDGIRFSCKPGQLETIESNMETYLASLGVASDWVVKKADRTNGVVVYQWRNGVFSRSRDFAKIKAAYPSGYRTFKQNPCRKRDPDRYQGFSIFFRV